MVKVEIVILDAVYNLCLYEGCIEILLSQRDVPLKLTGHQTKYVIHMVSKGFKTFETLMFFKAIFVNGQTKYVDNLFSDVRLRTFDYADTLNLDFYDASNDNLTDKPLLILVHGGGFSAGQRNGGEETNFGKSFAKKYYAVASIDYRLSRKGKSFGCDCASATKIKTYVEAVDDFSKAMHYLATYASDFKINPEKIILVGSSAGAETVLDAIILKYHYLFKNVISPKGNIIGAVSFSGATLNEDYLPEDSAVPMLFFHGEKNDVVPLATAAHRSCKESDDRYLLLDGPLEITQKLRELQVSYELYSDPLGTHKWADLGYRQTNIISQFLYSVVLGNEKIQKQENIAPN